MKSFGFAAVRCSSGQARKRGTAFALNGSRAAAANPWRTWVQERTMQRQACALCLQRASPPLCAIVAIDAAREAPMALLLRHGSLPARYRANEEKDHGLRRAFLKAPAAQKTHAASAFQKITAPAHRQAARRGYAPGSMKSFGFGGKASCSGSGRQPAPACVRSPAVTLLAGKKSKQRGQSSAPCKQALVAGGAHIMAAKRPAGIPARRI